MGMEFNQKKQCGAVVLFLFFWVTGAFVISDHKAVLCEYNRTRALILVEYASAVYIVDNISLLSWTCSRCKGLTKGFKVHTLVVDVQHCLQAFVGVAENLKAIVVAFRGTQQSSMQNWAEDLYFKELDLNYPGFTNALPMAGSATSGTQRLCVITNWNKLRVKNDASPCIVHSGFYTAYHNTTLRARVIDAVKAIQQVQPELSVIVTGHSMGGAMATFCALDLSVNYGFKDIEVFTFGQPRVGNHAFSIFYNEFVPLTTRVTHAHDLVPHLPPYYPILGEKTYHHFATEVWIYRISIGFLQLEFEKVCDISGEDPSCSRSVTGNSIADHLNYYGSFVH